MRKPTKKESSEKNEYMTIRDPGAEVREGLDELRREEFDEAGFQVDRTEMVRRLVRRALVAMNSKK